MITAESHTTTYTQYSTNGQVPNSIFTRFRFVDTNHPAQTSHQLTAPTNTSTYAVICRKQNLSTGVCTIMRILRDKVIQDYDNILIIKRQNQDKKTAKLWEFLVDPIMQFHGLSWVFVD